MLKLKILAGLASLLAATYWLPQGLLAFWPAAPTAGTAPGSPPPAAGAFAEAAPAGAWGASCAVDGADYVDFMPSTWKIVRDLGAVPVAAADAPDFPGAPQAQPDALEASRVSSGVQAVSGDPGVSKASDVPGAPGGSSGARTSTQAGDPIDDDDAPPGDGNAGSDAVQAVNVTAALETGPTNDDADDPAIWIHPTDPAQSLVIGSDKGSGIFTWDLAGRQVQFLASGEPNNVDVRYGFSLRGQPVDIVAAGNRATSRIDVYRVDPATRQLSNISGPGIQTGFEPYGFCLYRSPFTGRHYAFVNGQDGDVEQWELADNGGTVNGTRVRAFSVNSQPEGCVADDETGDFYLGEEGAGFWKFGAEPSAGSTRTQIDRTGGGHLVADVEGISIYYGPDGSGYLLVSSQGDSTFAVYERRAPHRYLASFSIGAGNGVDAVGDTDGIDVTNVAMGSNFAQGMFVAHDGSNDQGNNNYKMVRWADIARITSPPLLIDTVSYNPRGTGGSPPAATTAPTNPPVGPTNPPAATSTSAPPMAPTKTPGGGGREMSLTSGEQAIVLCPDGELAVTSDTGDRMVLACREIAPGAPTETPVPQPTSPGVQPTRTSPPPAGPFSPFGTVTIRPPLVLNGAGTNIDDPAFYEAGTDTMLFVTAKDNDVVEVWPFPFTSERSAISPGAQPNNATVDQLARRLYLSLANTSRVDAYNLPGLTRFGSFDVGGNTGGEPGLGSLRRPSGAMWSLVGDGSGNVRMFDTGTGAIQPPIRVGFENEAVEGDDYHQVIYVPDEGGQTGVYAFNPDGTPYRRGGTNRFGAGDFQSDAEGTVIWACPADGSSDDGRGLIVVSDQVDSVNDFEVYDRQDWRHLGIIRLTGVNNTDGIASTQKPLPGYPLGIFAAVDDDTSTALVGWHEILAATGIDCGGSPPPQAPTATATRPAVAPTATRTPVPGAPTATATRPAVAPTATRTPAAGAPPPTVPPGVQPQDPPGLPMPDPSFNARRIPIELQAWWAPEFGHIHAAAMLPLGQTVTGVLDFDVRIVLHDNPSHLFELRIDTDQGVFKRIPLDLRCPYDGRTSTNCAFNVPVSLDTSKMGSGWREIRIRATVETVDGKRFLNSSGVPLNIGGGGGGYDRWCNNTSLIGRGWYDGHGYTNAIIECVPQTPISGVHTFSVRAQKDSGHLQVALDKSHFIPAVGPWPEVKPSAGQILFDKDGNFQSFFPVSVDTRRLANGWHSLAVTSTGSGGSASDCDFCTGQENLPAGVAKIWFYVQN